MTRIFKKNVLWVLLAVLLCFGLIGCNNELPDKELQLGNDTESEEVSESENVTESEEITELEVTEPEITEPEVTEPEVTEPEVTEPEATEPEVTEPEVTEPEVTEPEVTDPEVTEPEVTEPEVTEPEVTEPEVTEPEITEPEVTEPEVTEPEVTEPEVTEPEVTEPEVTEPEITEPEVTEPEVTEPEVTDPEVTEPEVTEPEVTEPEVTEPEGTEPDEGWIRTDDVVCIGVQEVPLRAGPSLDDETVAYFDSGTELNRIKTNGIWDMVSVNGEIYYVETVYVTTAVDDFVFVKYNETGRVLLNVKEGFAVNLRNSPFYSGEISGANMMFSGFCSTETNEEGESLRLIAKSKSGDWFMVAFTGTWGYATYENQICYLKNTETIRGCVEGLPSESDSEETEDGEIEVGPDFEEEIESDTESESDTDPSYWETFFDEVPKLPGGTKLY